jgi:4-amino-4-deoxy-L-arabinose transferase-like glycosyltransferase
LEKRSKAFLPALAITLTVLFAIALYTAGVPANPPGFYIDESSIAFNAQSIATTGRDEHGVSWPLYFRAFGEFKNPIFIYALAAVFKITGPSIAVARALSALLGGAAALLVGLLAWNVSGRGLIGWIVSLSALFTPWLFEGSRLVFEVAAYPLVTVLFLLVLQKAATRRSWRIIDIVLLALCLALLTYTYSVGRLLGPLFAAGLLVFAGKGNRRAVALTLCGYLLTLIPLGGFAWRHPGALTTRLGGISYLNSQNSLAVNAVEFLKHYARDANPWAMLITGEDNLRDHIGGPALLLVTFILAIAGLVIVIMRHRKEPWWQFIIYALAASVVPAALTSNYFPQLRLLVFPVLVHVLMVPALQQLAAKQQNQPKLILSASIVLIVLQGAYFQFVFHRNSPARWYFMDARFPRKVFEPAADLNRVPIYLYDPPGSSGYIQPFWYGALRGMAQRDFVRIDSPAAVPPNNIVISTDQNCRNCRLIAHSFNYTVYVVLPSELRPALAPLPPEGFRADVSLRQVPASLPAGRQVTLRASVRNVSSVSWPSIGEDDGRYAVHLRARWRNQAGEIIADAGQSRFDYDLEPGDVNDTDLVVNVPAAAGDYLLEIDVIQEPGVWFAERGSRALMLRLKVV